MFDWYGVATQSWLAAGITFAAVSLVLFGLRALLYGLLVRRTSGRLAALAELIKQTQPLFLLAVAAYVAVSPLELDDPLADYLYKTFLAVFLLQVGFWVLALLEAFWWTISSSLPPSLQPARHHKLVPWIWSIRPTR